MAVSASASGYLSMYYFKHDMVMVRKCTIIGMSAGLSAFFGVQLGGKLSPAWLLRLRCRRLRGALSMPIAASAPRFSTSKTGWKYFTK